MHIHIVAGGPKEYLPSLQDFQEENVIWVGADRGVYYLLEQGIVPHEAFGDFDSVTEEELSFIQEKITHVHIFPSQKDETDLEIAISWALEQQPTNIKLFGVTGGRFDHTLANMQLLVKGIEQKVLMEILDRQNRICMKEAGEYSVQKEEEYPYLSFVPFTKEVTGIFLRGFKYSLTNASIQWGSTLCISNELVEDTGTYSFLSGIVIMVRSKD
ncbi:thiamine diphosphokinase [Priestia taiwanensis]|uniref:Thiamine diphosphokinase n=1 Tax=Priestia taiwanensis TaxID=1347902 RepID=A0A917AQ09_9BACI|nr:thiamine diphosphokinase [Priestia taiwanensis]MBM7362882.1 thiamine pyrophosphokinase [Priestia taiwanensis]GGE65877.1 thiamine pyrophosphokinase [Priestia taiwanensis]